MADIHNCRIIQFFGTNCNSLIYFLKNHRHILLAGGAMGPRLREDAIYNGLINVKVIISGNIFVTVLQKDKIESALFIQSNRKISTIPPPTITKETHTSA